MPELSQDILEGFGRKVKTARLFRNWKLKELAERISDGTPNVPFLSQIESGKRKISAATAARLITALDLDKFLLDPFLNVDIAEEEEVTKSDRDAARLMARVERESAAPGTGQALLIALAYEFAEGPHLDLQTAYQGLRAALESAQKIKARGEMPSNTGDQIKRIMAEVARLNDDGQRDAAADMLEAEMDRLEAERETLFGALLDQDRIRNRPEDAAKRLIRNLHQSAPPGGVWQATRDLIRKWLEDGETQGAPFDLQVALALARHNWNRAGKPQKEIAVDDLGNCQLAIGRRSKNDGHLKNAIAAFQESVKLSPRRSYAKNWAVAQNNLGIALAALGAREADPARLRAAIDAFTQALTVRTRDAAPMDWAATQNNLGTALSNLGEREADPAHLRAAIDACTAALEVWTPKAAPRDWAKAKGNLGLACRWLGALTADTDKFNQAQSAFALCLQEWRPDTVPFDWAKTRWNQGDLALARHALAPDPALLTEARAHVMAAREIFTEGSDYQTEQCDDLLARIDAAEHG